MGALFNAFAICVLTFNGATAAPPTNDASLPTRALGLTVDLGYASYKGYQNSATGIRIWKGYDGFLLRNSTTYLSILLLTHNHL
jgi:hypothetical protein